MLNVPPIGTPVKCYTSSKYKPAAQFVEITCFLCFKANIIFVLFKKKKSEIAKAKFIFVFVNRGTGFSMKRCVMTMKCFFFDLFGILSSMSS